jgi:Golgi phosphoprotein 3 (GPP34)
VARLSGTGLLADDLYLMAHDDVTGRAVLQSRALGLGLAGGLLAELMLLGSLRLWDGWLMPGDQAPPPDDLGRFVLGLVLAERQACPVREWLAFLARTAAADVAERLGRAGYLAQVPARRLWRAWRWVPTDPDCAFAPLARARPALETPGPASSYGTILAGLAVACGLGSRLLPYGPPGARGNLAVALERLAPGQRELIAQVQAAVDSAVLAQRT